MVDSGTLFWIWSWYYSQHKQQCFQHLLPWRALYAACLLVSRHKAFFTSCTLHCKDSSSLFTNAVLSSQTCLAKGMAGGQAGNSEPEQGTLQASKPVRLEHVDTAPQITFSYGQCWGLELRAPGELCSSLLHAALDTEKPRMQGMQLLSAAPPRQA